MNMIRLDIQLKHLNQVFLLYQAMDFSPRIFRDFSLQYPMPILRTTHYMKLAFINGMR